MQTVAATHGEVSRRTYEEGYLYEKLLYERLARSLLLVVLPLAMASAVRADEVTDWHEHMLVALGNAGIRPPASTRDAALVSAAVFDAVNGIERRYAPIHVPAAAPRGASKRAAAVQAAYVILLARFPAQADDLNAKRAASLAAIGDAKANPCGAAWSGDRQSPRPFSPGAAPMDSHRRRRPISADTNQANGVRPRQGMRPGVLPQFATMTPWGILSPDQFRPAGPPALDSAQYLAEFDEVRQMGSATSALRTADQTDACLFVNSTSATYLWNRVAIDLAAAHGIELSENARLLATLNLAIADARHCLLGCEILLRVLATGHGHSPGDADGDGNPDDPTWTPLFATPAHPEYTSGHSSDSGAAATVLADYFGDDTPFMLQSPADPGWVRFYPSFSAAVDEVADARVFAGIHFRTACEDGVATSSDVAAYILENLMGASTEKANSFDCRFARENERGATNLSPRSTGAAGEGLPSSRASPAARFWRGLTNSWILRTKVTRSILSCLATAAIRCSPRTMTLARSSTMINSW